MASSPAIDRVITAPLARIGDFAFDEHVAADGSNIYDLGCSTGTTLALIRRVQRHRAGPRGRDRLRVHRARGARNHRIYAVGLVTEGLFRHTRNPMYVGKFLMIVGDGSASNRWSALLVIAAVYSFMYHAVTLAKEAYLRAKFGEAFDEYCRRVPRWWPRLDGIAETLGRTRYNSRRVLLKEYSAPLGLTLPTVPKCGTATPCRRA